MKLEEYLDRAGRSPFGDWFGRLDARAAAALTGLGQGNPSNVESVGEGVSEYKIDFGPGYRIYFGRERRELIILIGGGTKKRQQRDIDAAKSLWAEFRTRRKGKT